MRLPLHKSITTHSQYWHSGMCCYFYSLSIIEFTYFMYKIVNKVTFIVADTIKAYIKKSIKPINTTSLSDNKSYRVQWQHISTTMFISYVSQYNIEFKINQYKRNKFSLKNIKRSFYKEYISNNPTEMCFFRCLIFSS